MKILQPKVEKILAKSEAARNSDTELYIQYFEEYICEYPEEKQFIRTMLEKLDVSFASLNRVRAFIQNNEGKYPSDKQVQKYREELEKDYVEDYSPINNGTRY